MSSFIERQHVQEMIILLAHGKLRILNPFFSEVFHISSKVCFNEKKSELNVGAP